MEKKYNLNGYPSFFVGDMNAIPTQKAVKTYGGAMLQTIFLSILIF